VLSFVESLLEVAVRDDSVEMEYGGGSSEPKSEPLLVGAFAIDLTSRLKCVRILSHLLRLIRVVCGRGLRLPVVDARVQLLSSVRRDYGHYYVCGGEVLGISAI